MSYPAFSSVTLSNDDTQLEVVGQGADELEIVRVDAAVISTDDEERRLDNFAVGDPDDPAALLSNPWTVVLDQSDMPDYKAPFAPRDKVIVVGVATSKDGTRTIWGGISGADATVAATTTLR
jgi:hypothetical protein